MRSAFTYFISYFALIAAASVLAADTPAGGAFPWEGEVTGSNVYVRSGAGANWYPTTKLNTGERLLVLGEKFGWYQITPPRGSFSYVDMAAVDRKPGAKTGTLKQDKVYIRVGSSLEQRKNATQLVLNKGATVEILGEAEGFFKIAPPPGASLYISKQYVKPIESRLTTGMVQQHLAGSQKPGMSPQTTPAPAVAKPSPTPSAAPSTPANTQAPITQTDATNLTIPPAQQPAAQPVASNNDGATAVPDEAGITVPEGQNDLVSDSTGSDADGPINETPQAEIPADTNSATDVSAGTPPESIAKPSDLGSAEFEPAEKVAPATDRYSAKLTVLEGELVSMLTKPLEEQDPSELIKRYEELATQTEENIPAEVAKIRIRQLKDRGKLRESRVAMHQDEADLSNYRANMGAERMRIMKQKILDVEKKWDLEGELRRSLAFAPENRRFRLVDRETQSTIAYVDIPRSVDENPEHLIGQMVGIRAAGKTFSPSARVPIAVAGKIVDLSSRELHQGEQPHLQSPLDEMPPPASTDKARQSKSGKKATPDRTASSDDPEGNAD